MLNIEINFTGIEYFGIIAFYFLESLNMNRVDMMIDIFLKAYPAQHWPSSPENFLKAPTLLENLEHVEQHLNMLIDLPEWFRSNGRVRHTTLLEGVILELERSLSAENEQKAELLKEMFYDYIKGHYTFIEKAFSIEDVNKSFSLDPVTYKKFHLTFDFYHKEILQELLESFDNILQSIEKVKHVKKLLDKSRY